jgi:hypothetical protein
MKLTRPGGGKRGVGASHDAKGGPMRAQNFGLVIVAGLATACLGDKGAFREPIREQRLPSGKVVNLVSCLLAWGVEHDQRFPDQHAFALEYVSTVPRESPQGLEREVLEVFELIRPISQQWGPPTATVSALRSPDRTGTWDVFAFKRSASGTWSHSSQALTRKKE